MTQGHWEVTNIECAHTNHVQDFHHGQTPTCYYPVDATALMKSHTVHKVPIRSLLLQLSDGERSLMQGLPEDSEGGIAMTNQGVKNLINAAKAQSA